MAKIMAELKKPTLRNYLREMEKALDNEGFQDANKVEYCKLILADLKRTEALKRTSRRFRKEHANV